MDDTISRKAALDASEKIIKDCNPEHFVGHQKFIKYMDNVEIGSFGNWQFANGFNMGLTAAEVAIEKLPSAQQEPQWIPCSERMPEENGRYLVTRGLNACGALWNRVHIINYSDLMGLKSERIWWNGNVGKSDFERIDDVVAWMPLPKPWKGEKDETD